MARVRQPAPTPPTGFIASAVRLPTASRNVAGRSEGWQSQAWQFWETVGELRAVSVWIGNVLSRARLIAGKREGRMIVPMTDATHPATEAMEALYGGPQGQEEMLRQYGIHDTVAGELYIVNTASDDRWYSLAAGKVTQLPGGKLQADFGTEGGAKPLKPADLVIRQWTPHPRDPSRADSPVRSNLTTLAQITGYDQHISAQIRSRLAGAGILFLSNEVSFPVPEGVDPGASQAQIFMALLGEAMMTPIQDPSDPSALVPIVAMVPTESLGKNEHLKFWTDLDNAVVEMRDAGIKRLALGMDVPPEVLLGVADANHWNAWLSEESAVKAHLEPRLGNFAWGLSNQYLRPAIKGRIPASESLEDYYVLADTSSIRLRPNRSSEAIELYNLGELSGEALRRETGFQPEDSPDSTEFERWLLKRVSTGAVSPEQTAAALKLLGIDLGPINVSTGQQQPDHTRLDTKPALEQRNVPDIAESQERAMSQDGLAAACDVLVFRALERAGNRLRNGHPRTDTSMMAAVDVYRTLGGEADNLLAGAWDCAAEVLGPYTADTLGVTDTLDFYVRGLLSSHRPHSSVVLSALLASRPTALAVT
jgi:hypothetical protein